MGLRVQLRLYAENEASAKRAASAAFDTFERLEGVFSDYSAESELSQFVAKAGHGPQPISKDLMVVLVRAQDLARKSDGAFDVTASPIIRLWRTARREQKLPRGDALLSGLDRTGWRGLRLDPDRGTAELVRKGMMLDLGGIAKGYACDAAIQAMRAVGVSRAMVDAGGDIAVGDPPPGQKGWRVEIRGLPSEVLELANEGLSTSGDTEQFLDIGGVRYSHIVDPRTGFGLTTRTQVTVRAPKAFDTDGLATTLSVLGPTRGLRLAEREGVRCLFLGTGGKVLGASPDWGRTVPRPD